MPFPCPHCSKSYKNLKEHITKTHNQIKITITPYSDEGVTDPSDYHTPEFTVKFPDIDEVFTGDDIDGDGLYYNVYFFVEQHKLEYCLYYDAELKTVDLRRPTFKSKADRKAHNNDSHESVFIKPENITINPPIPYKS